MPPAPAGRGDAAGAGRATRGDRAARAGRAAGADAAAASAGVAAAAGIRAAQAAGVDRPLPGKRALPIELLGPLTGNQQPAKQEPDAGNTDQERLKHHPYIPGILRSRFAENARAQMQHAAGRQPSRKSGGLSRPAQRTRVLVDNAGHETSQARSRLPGRSARPRVAGLPDPAHRHLRDRRRGRCRYRGRRGSRRIRRRRPRRSRRICGGQRWCGRRARRWRCGISRRRCGQRRGRRSGWYGRRTWRYGGGNRECRRWYRGRGRRAGRGWRRRSRVRRRSRRTALLDRRRLRFRCLHRLLRRRRRRRLRRRSARPASAARLRRSATRR